MHANTHTHVYPKRLTTHTHMSMQTYSHICVYTVSLTRADSFYDGQQFYTQKPYDDVNNISNKATEATLL